VHQEKLKAEIATGHHKKVTWHALRRELA